MLDFKFIRVNPESTIKFQFTLFVLEATLERNFFFFRQGREYTSKTLLILL